MKKKLPASCIILFTCILVHGQNFLLDPSLEGLYKFSKNYFRSDPFKDEFSGFLNHLINDPSMTQKEIRKRTDTSLYSFRGIYTAYNPFFFTPKRVEIRLGEVAMGYPDSLKAADTIFVYELFAYADDNADGAASIRKEFEKIHRQNKNRFFESNYKEVKTGNEVVAVMHNYFLPAYLLSPLSVIQGKENNELFLNIALRFKRTGNQVVIPSPANSQ